MCSFDLIPNLDTFTTYFLFNYLCALQKDVRFYTQGQWICGNYLEISYNIQVYLKGRSWGLFHFLLLIMTTHLQNTCIPVVILVKHEAWQMLA